MVKIVSVKFKNGGKPYYFAPGKDSYEKGMGVIVETAKGLEYATVVAPEGEVDEGEIVTPLKPVVRIATKRDEEQVQRNRERRGEALKTAQEKIAARGLEMKLVDCEFAFDGSKVVFFFTSESRVDFRELIKDLSSAFHMRIELRQISIRDEIKLTGGLAPCGRECCCIGCMSEPFKVSVKMAKNQGLSLNPTKISGLCGRLMCCLAYENDYYSEACKKVPKLGSEVDTPEGKGSVVNVNMLKMQVKVKIEQNDSVSYRDFGVDEIKFMRGNVVMGASELGAADDGGEETEKGEKPSAPVAEKPRGNLPDRREGRNGNRDGRGEKNDRREGNRNNGERRDNRENRRKDARPDRREGNRNNGGENRPEHRNNAPAQRNNGGDNEGRDNAKNGNEGAKNFNKNKRRDRRKDGRNNPADNANGRQSRAAGRRAEETERPLPTIKGKKFIFTSLQFKFCVI